ncbi:MAG: hypothetical protein H6Q15_127 [Bacteroidetes bacterium]|nr:hypothetical protein [Bacteroidota bacterium]
MKRKASILLLFLFFGYVANSQINVKLDSITEGWGTDIYEYYRKASIYSSIDLGNDSILEKGIFIYSNDGYSPLLMFINQGLVESSTLFLPIKNMDFDTIVYFIPNMQSIKFQSYAIKNTDTIYSDSIIDLNLPIIDGLKDINNDNIQVKVYPTIVKNILNIESSGYPLSLSVVDAFGREIFSETLSSNKSINCNHLKTGTYICNIRDIKTNKSISKKLIKQ